MKLYASMIPTDSRAVSYEVALNFKASGASMIF